MINSENTTHIILTYYQKQVSLVPLLPVFRSVLVTDI